MSSYSDNDLKTAYFAIKGGMSILQLACLFSISEKDAQLLKEESIEKFKQWVDAPPPKFPRQKFKPPEKQFHHKPVKGRPSEPLIRPAATYDNKSSQERIDYYLSLDI